MIHARARCWIHEDCLIDLELAIACGPNPFDMQVLDADWAEVADFGGGYNYGNGIGGGWSFGYSGSDGGGGWVEGDGGGDSFFGDGDGGGFVDGGQR